MAFGGRANAFDARRRDKYRRGVARGHIIDDVVEVEEGRAIPCACSGSCLFHSRRSRAQIPPFARIIQAQIMSIVLGASTMADAGRGVAAR